MVTYLNPFPLSLKTWTQESACHLISAREFTHPLKDRVIHAGLALILSIPLIKTIAQIFFSSLYQFYTLQAKLDAWEKKYVPSGEEKSNEEQTKSVKIKILDCYRDKQVKLDLSGHQLSSLPDIFNLLTQLTTLNLDENQLTELPESITKLTGLTVLSLLKNQLTELPESIGSLVQLTTLDLWNNRLTELPGSIGSLVQLTTLDLWNNRLTELPESITKLTELTTLDLYGNRLTKLPEPIGNLTQLTTLDLQDNQLTFLPDSFFNLNSNLKCYLTDNRFSKGESDAIREKARDKFVVFHI